MILLALLAPLKLAIAVMDFHSGFRTRVELLDMLFVVSSSAHAE